MDSTFPLVLEYVDDIESGAIQATAYQDAVCQPENTTMAQHYGFCSYPPKDTELVGVADEAGRVVSVAENVNGRPAITSKQVALYDEAGNRITLKDTAGGITLAAQGANPVVTESPTLLGSASAAEPILKGLTLLTGFGAFLTSWKSAADTLAASAGLASDVKTYASSVSGAIATLAGLIAGWASNKHMIDS